VFHERRSFAILLRSKVTDRGYKVMLPAAQSSPQYNRATN
jgi:hypothetical protein